MVKACLKEMGLSSRFPQTSKSHVTLIPPSRSTFEVQVSTSRTLSRGKLLLQSFSLVLN